MSKNNIEMIKIEKIKGYNSIQDLIEMIDEENEIIHNFVGYRDNEINKKDLLIDEIIKQFDFDSLPIKKAAKSQNSLVRTCRDITQQGLTAKGKDDNGNDVEITLPPEVMSMIVNFVSPLPEENLGSSLFDIMKLEHDQREQGGSKAPVTEMIKQKGFVEKLKKESENPSPPEQGPLK